MTSDLLIITAKGTGSWLREHLSPSGLVRMFGEGLIGDYAEKMELLREVDENIANWTNDLEKLVSQARSAVKHKKILDAAIILSRINQQLKQVTLEGKRVQQVQEQALREFEAQHELELPEEFTPKAAGMLDNLKHRWVANKLKSELTAKKMVVLEALLRTAEKVVHGVRSHLKAMGVARDHGNIGKYVDILSKVSGLQTKFEGQFNAAYQNYFKDLIDALPKEMVEKLPETVNEPVVNTEPAGPLPLVSPPMTEGMKTVAPMTEGEKTVTTPVNFSGIKTVTTPVNFPISQEPSEQTMISPQLPSVSDLTKKDKMKPESPETRLGLGELGFPEGVEPVPQTVRTPVMAMWNQKFIKELIRLADNEDTGLMVCAAVKYSEQIEDLDPELSEKLLSLAQELIDR